LEEKLAMPIKRYKPEQIVTMLIPETGDLFSGLSESVFCYERASASGRVENVYTIVDKISTKVLFANLNSVSHSVQF
jgi:hypothetical protein